MLRTRENYAALYTPLHEAKNGKYFPGKTVVRYVGDIRNLVLEQNARTLLDYGSGKGKQYEPQHNLIPSWNNIVPHMYDVGFRAFSRRPKKKFDGVFSSDMMEHIAEYDVDAVLEDIFSFVEDDHAGFVFIALGCTPSPKKRLLDGRNVHLTIKPPAWWHERLTAATERRRHHNLRVELACELDLGGFTIDRMRIA